MCACVDALEKATGTTRGMGGGKRNRDRMGVQRCHQTCVQQIPIHAIAKLFMDVIR